MHKRPALLTEARALYQQANSGGHIEWYKPTNPLRGPTPIRFSGRKTVAVPYKSSVLVLGSSVFGTTEFMGLDLKHQICSPSEHVKENMRFYEINLRVALEMRNGHEIWRVYFVQTRKGNEEIMR